MVGCCERGLYSRVGRDFGMRREKKEGAGGRHDKEEVTRKEAITGATLHQYAAPRAHYVCKH